MPEMRKSYHTFRRRDDRDDSLFVLKCLVTKASSPVHLRVLVEHILEALERKGQADGQNCTGAICVVKSKAAFKHHVSLLVDWWRNRLYIYVGCNKKGVPICVVYAHYDKIDALFDGDVAGLKRLIKRAKENDGIPVDLFPVARGRHSRTGRPITSGPSGPSGKVRPHGQALRELNNLRARGIVPIPVAG